eukprot:9994008-Karenia_brevis.AAC.1
MNAPHGRGYDPGCSRSLALSVAQRLEVRCENCGVEALRHHVRWIPRSFDLLKCYAPLGTGLLYPQVCRVNVPHFPQPLPGYYPQCSGRVRIHSAARFFPKIF